MSSIMGRPSSQKRGAGSVDTERGLDSIYTILKAGRALVFRPKEGGRS